jgi:hypothetical protein
MCKTEGLQHQWLSSQCQSIAQSELGFMKDWKDFPCVRGNI